MSILVTGGAGYIGSHMVLELIQNGENVIVLDNLSTGNKVLVDDRAELYIADIADTDIVTKIINEHNITSIIHFAGSIVVPESVSDPLKYYLNNTSKSRALIETAIKNNIQHFIFSSTAAVYGMPEKNPVAEDAPLKPISPYGASKMMTEMMLQDVANAHSLTFAVLRYFNVAGADPEGRTGQSTPEATHLIKVANQVALGQREALSVFGTDYQTPDGTCIRDYIHVSDLAKAHLLALNYLKDGNESTIMNCGYGKGYSVNEVINTVKEVSSVDFPVKYTERRPGDPAILVAAADKISHKLNWIPQYNDISTIVTHALKWEKSIKI